MKRFVFFVELQLTIDYLKFTTYCTFSTVNSIFFFAQLQQSNCFLIVIFEGFFINNNDIHVIKQQNLYVLQFDKFITCLIVNFNMLQM